MVTWSESSVQSHTNKITNNSQLRFGQTGRLRAGRSEDQAVRGGEGQGQVQEPLQPTEEEEQKW